MVGSFGFGGVCRDLALTQTRYIKTSHFASHGQLAPLCGACGCARLTVVRACVRVCGAKKRL